MKRLTIVSIIIVLLCSACSSPKKKNLSIEDCNVIAEKSTNGRDSFLVCNLSSVKDTVIVSLSSLLFDFEIIKLEDSEDAIVKNDGHIAVSENYIGIYSFSAGGYKVYNKRGEYLHTLSSKGNGPNEYLFSIYDSCIDEVNKKVYLLPMMSNHILVYDLNGNPLPSIPLAYKVDKGRFQIENDKQEILLTVMPFQENQSIAWKQDMVGNLIQEVTAGNLALQHVDFSNEMNYSFNTKNADFSIFHWTPQLDTLYHFNEYENRLIPVLTLQFRNEVSQHDYVELPNHYLISLMDPKASRPSMILLDKKTLKGAFVKFELDMLGGIKDVDWPVFNRGYYLANVYPHEIKEELQHVIENKDKMTNEVYETVNTIYDAINENSNNIILIGKLKENTTDNFTLKKINIRTTDNKITSVANKDSPTEPKEDKDEDEKIYRFSDLNLIKETPILDPDPGIEYFKINNKYKDWNPDDQKEVTVGYVVEKDGTASHVTIIKSSGIESLDNEAVRLISQARFLPGTNLNGDYIRCGDQQIPVFFPPR